MSEETLIRKIDLEDLKRDMTDMKSLMSRMVEAMSRITVIEERQHDLSQVTSKAMDRMEMVAEKQHAYEIISASNSSMAGRVTVMETAFRELHLEGERNKARFGTIIWLVHGLWALVGGGGLIWIFQALAHAPVK